MKKEIQTKKIIMQKRIVNISLLTILFMMSITIPILAINALEIESEETWFLNPIFIDENGPYTWEDAVNEPWCKGSGTKKDPYIIKNVIINGEGSHYCMRIHNSEVYFKIMNCKFYNTKPLIAGGNAGLILFNTKNGLILKNHFFDNGIIGTGSGSGIALINSHYNVIQKNNCSNNEAVGIYLSLSEENTVILNFCEGNGWGIGLMMGRNNIIIHNTCLENIGTGIFVQGSYDNTISENLCMGNVNGISIGIWGTRNNKIIQNDCLRNSENGIYAYGSDYNELIGNNCSENSEKGIFIDGVHHYKIQDNNINNNKFGIYLEYGTNIDIYENNFIENQEIGFYIVSGYNNIIYHNNFIDNTLHVLDNVNNNWNENYWSDYPGTDNNKDGIGDTHIPWPDYGYDSYPFVEKDGWE